MMDTCRICLRRSEGEEYYNIFLGNNGNGQESLAVMLKACALVEVSEDDHLPKSVCSGCKPRLLDSFLLRNQIIDSDLKLRTDPLQNTSGTSQNDENKMINQVYCAPFDNLCKGETADFEDDHDDPTDDMYEVPLKEEDEDKFDSENATGSGEIHDSTRPEKSNSKDYSSYGVFYTNDSMNDSSFFCDTCMKPFSYEAEYKKHMQVHNGSETFTCEQCGETFELIGYYREHVRTAHPEEKPYSCDICNKSFKDKKLVWYHKKRMHPVELENSKTTKVISKKGKTLLKAAIKAIAENENEDDPAPVPDNDENIAEHSTDEKMLIENYKLETTGEDTDTIEPKPGKSEIIEVLENKVEPTIGKPKTKSRRVPCPECKRTFKSKHYLEIHQRGVHTGIKPYACDQCNKSFAALYQLKLHKKSVHVEGRPFACDQCDKAYRTMGPLKIHLLVHQGKKPHVCKTCGKAFTYRTSLSTHELAHNGEKPFVCEMCGKSFRDKAALSKHFNSHWKLKTVQCNICSKLLADNHTLVDHLRTHTGERPFNCEVCSKKFSTKKALKVHMRIHDGIKPYSCTICGKQFTQSNTLVGHMRVHTGEKPYKCDICCKKFSFSHHLSKHIQKYHPDSR